MKSIVLHDGRKAHFPDNATPEVMGPAIAKLLTVKPAEPKANPAADDAKKRVADTQKRMADEKKRQDDREKQANAEKKAHADRENRRDEDAHVRHNDHMRNNAENLKATNGLADTVNDGLAGVHKRLETSAVAILELGQQVEKLSEGMGVVQELADNVASLEKSIVKATDTIVKAMRAKRRIIHSPKGKPIGMEYDE